MKRITLLLIVMITCFAVSSLLCEQATAIAPEISTQLIQPFPHGNVIDSLQMKNDNDVDNTLILLDKQSEKTLVIYYWSKKDGCWKERIRTSNAIPQGRNDEGLRAHIDSISKGSELYAHSDVWGEHPLYLMVCGMK